ncbi:MAG: reverse transcriptase family protein [Bacteroidota bacterium]
MGDFNIDLLRFNSNQDVLNFLDILGSHLILPKVLLPTRITERSKTLIDNIFSSTVGENCISGNILHSISDHLAQFLLLPGDNPYSDVNMSRTLPDWSKFNQDSFLREFRALNWHEVLSLEGGDVNFSFDSFNTKVSDLVDRHLPTKRLSKRQLVKKPWITSGILKSMSKRDTYFRRFLRSKSEESKVFNHSLFRQYRNQIVALCRRSKADYYANYFHSNSTNIRKIWQGINEIISLKPKSTRKPISLRIDDAVTSDPLLVANHFNRYFSSIAESIRSRIPTSDKCFTSFLNGSTQNSIFLSPVTSDEVAVIINSMSPSKGSGPNSIPYRILKLLSPEISALIAQIVNISFSTGVFPSTLKLSKVIPVFKKGSPLEPSNYRPISLLSNIEKIFEKLMYSRLISFLENNSIIYSRQFGFRKSHSTSHALINLIERIRQCLDKNQYAVGIFVDLQKAFDTVDHKILCRKLNHYGIRGVANQWFSSYLSFRSQFVSLADAKSDLCYIQHGVPQGSVLRPLLFLIYINDLHSSLKFSEVTHFADDTNLFQFGESLDILSRNLNSDLSLLNDWLNANKIALNSAKTEYILFKNRLKTFVGNLETYLDGNMLNPSSSVKYLGVYLDEHLTWNPYISDICNKLRRSNGALSKIRHYVPPDTLLGIYHAHFGSHLRYACQLWGLNPNIISRRALILQKCAIRLISFSPPRSPSAPLFSRLKILNVFDLVKLFNILFVHQYLNSELPSDLYSTFSFKRIDHSYPTRGQNLGLLKVPKISTTKHGSNSLSYQAITQWNLFQQKHPNAPLSEMPLSQLKSLVTSFLFSQY